jgi:hypothetical protein
MDDIFSTWSAILKSDSLSFQVFSPDLTIPVSDSEKDIG